MEQNIFIHPPPPHSHYVVNDDRDDGFIVVIIYTSYLSIRVIHIAHRNNMKNSMMPLTTTTTREGRRRRRRIDRDKLNLLICIATKKHSHIYTRTLLCGFSRRIF